MLQLLWSPVLILAAAAGFQSQEPIRLGRPAKITVTPPALHRASITFSPDGKSLAWMHFIPDLPANERGGLFIHLWDIEKKLPLSEMKAANEYTFASSPLRFVPTGRMLAAACFQLTTEQEELGKPGTPVKNNVRVWLAASGRELPIVNREEGTVDGIWQAIAFSPDARTMTAVSSKTGKVWSLPDGKVIRQFEIEATAHVVLSADSTLVAASAKDQSVRIWKTEDGKQTQALPGSGRALGFSPDCKRLATLHGAKICLWDIESGKQLWETSGIIGKDEHHGQRFDFSPDGKRLAWNEDGKIMVADAATGKVSLTLASQPGPISFSPDGRRLALACPDGTALVWTLP